MHQMLKKSIIHWFQRYEFYRPNVILLGSTISRKIHSKFTDATRNV